MSHSHFISSNGLKIQFQTILVLRCRALMALDVKEKAKQISNAFVQLDSVVPPAKMLVGIRMIFFDIL
jgi:hypothetical protein